VRVFLLAFLAFFVVGLPVWSSSAGEAWVCDAATNNAQHLDCAERELKKHEADLKRVLGQAMAQASEAGPAVPGYGPPPAEALRQSQLVWRDFREKNCHWKSTSFYGGSGQAVIAASCRALMTRDRVGEIKASLAP
jgi:uncharacterized protein YecT (DUF1311 family)